VHHEWNPRARYTLVGLFKEPSAARAMITKDFIIANDFCTYTTIILRQDKRLRGAP
jgi:hypothetical protein